jgi:mono/diheme cytochrome c family protein
MRQLSIYAGAFIVAVFLAAHPCAAQSATDTYKAKCQMCHGADGLGNTPAGKAMLAHPFNSASVTGASDADLITIIQHGKNKMPAFTGKLSDAQTKELVTYIRSLH